MIRSAKPSPLTSPAPLTEQPELIVRVDAIEAEAVGAVEAREVERCHRSRRVAEHHVALAGACIGRPDRRRSPDDQVGEAIAVDVPGRRSRSNPL